MLFISACGTVTERSGPTAESFGASAAWRWENTDGFLIRGRARLQDRSRVFSGPFIIRASRELSVVRADFCGPDGSPLLSLRIDSCGSLAYAPDQGSAWWVPGGVPFGKGLLDVNAVISLIRTGFPHLPVHWEIAHCATGLEEPEWLFTAGPDADTMRVTLETGGLLPRTATGDLSLTGLKTSWHDSFALWPLEWELDSPELSVILLARSIDEVQSHPEGTLELQVPVPVDSSFLLLPEWEYASVPPVR